MCGAGSGFRAIRGLTAIGWLSSSGRGGSTSSAGCGSTGRIALTYVGDEEFRHGFRAEVRGARLAHIALPVGMSGEEGRRRLRDLLDVADRFAESTVEGAVVLREPPR